MVRKNRPSTTTSNKQVVFSGNLRNPPASKLTIGKLFRVLLGSTLILYGVISAIALFFTGKMMGSVFTLIVPIIGLFLIFHKPAPPQRDKRVRGYSSGGRR